MKHHLGQDTLRLPHLVRAMMNVSNFITVLARAVNSQQEINYWWIVCMGRRICHIAKKYLFKAVREKLLKMTKRATYVMGAVTATV